MLTNAVELRKMASKAANIRERVCDIFDLNGIQLDIQIVKVLACERLNKAHRISPFNCALHSADFWV
ncbi:TPA: hypothetical protein ACUB6T_005491 [Klebsiella michiganensis]